MFKTLALGSDCLTLHPGSYGVSPDLCPLVSHLSSEDDECSHDDKDDDSSSNIYSIRMSRRLKEEKKVL